MVIVFLVWLLFGLGMWFWLIMLNINIFETELHLILSMIILGLLGPITWVAFFVGMLLAEGLEDYRDDQDDYYDR